MRYEFQCFKSFIFVWASLSTQWNLTQCNYIWPKTAMMWKCMQKTRCMWRVWMKCAAKFESKMNECHFSIYETWHYIQLSRNVLSIIHTIAVCMRNFGISEMQRNTVCISSFKINFLLNFGLLNSVKLLSSENMSKTGEINV